MATPVQHPTRDPESLQRTLMQLREKVDKLSKDGETLPITAGQHGVLKGGELHPPATGSYNGFMSSADKAKLDEIEDAATADQTATELLTLIKTVDGTGSGLDGDTLRGLTPGDLRAAADLTGLVEEVQDIVGAMLAVTGGDGTYDDGAGTYNIGITQASGTVTPAIVGGTVAGVGTYSTQTGSYVRMADRVFFQLEVEWSAHTGSGDLIVSGLPVTPAADAALTVWAELDTATSVMVQAYAVSGTTTVHIYEILTGAPPSNARSQLYTTGRVMLSGNYAV